MDNVRPIIVVALIISLGFLVIVLKFPISSEKKEEIMNLGKEIIERPRPKFGWLGEKVEKFILLTSHVGTIAGVLQKLKTVIGLE